MAANAGADPATRPGRRLHRIDQDRRAALQFDNRSRRKRYGRNKPRAPECYGCNNMRVN